LYQRKILLAREFLFFINLASYSLYCAKIKKDELKSGAIELKAD
jgi:hypothetical protein